MAQLRITPLPIILRRLIVLDVRSVTDRMRRVTVGGPELGCFERDGLTLPGFTSEAFDDHVKLIFTAEGDIADALPVQRALGIEWGRSEHRLTRDYTPVHVDVDGGSMAFDFVIHTDGAERGPAETWASTAVPGDDLWIVGPKSSTVVPADAEWALLAGDETAQPAVERFLLDRPITGPARIVLTIADESARRDLPLGPDDTITWVVAAPGDRDALADAVRALRPLPGVAYAWAAAESRSLLAVRKHVARELGIPKDHTDITGYWHKRDSEPSPAVTSEIDNAPAPSVVIVESPVTWFAVRAAMRLGLLDVVDAHRPDRAGLAARLALPDGRADPLVDILIAGDVVEEVDGRLGLGDVGETLLADPHAAEAFDGAEADQILALADLAEALPAGRSAWEARTGQTYGAHVRSSTALFAELVDESTSRVFLLPAIEALPALSDRDSIGFCGPSAAVVADGLQKAGRIDRVATTILGTGPELEALRAASSGDHAYTDVDATRPPVDLLVAADAFAHLDDAETEAFLRSAAEYTSSLLVIESTTPDALGTGVLEDALVHLAVVGEPPRNADRLAVLVAAAGWTVVDSVALGWGVDAVTLTSAT